MKSIHNVHDVQIYDTTLRDGVQGEGVNLSVADKLCIAERLAAFGVHFIEGGWPGANPTDAEFFREAQKRDWGLTRLVAFGATRKKNKPVKDDLAHLIEARTPAVAVFGKSSPLHVKFILETTKEENRQMITDTVAYLKQHGRIVIYDAEHAFDGYKEEPAYALSTWEAARDAGADCIVLCDTNGGALPDEVSEIVAAARNLGCPIGIHTHDDCGLAVANALAALKAGAVHVQGTVNGHGERIGNCNLTTLLPILSLKLHSYCIGPAALTQLKPLSRFVAQIMNVRHNPRQPWVGEQAFAHKAGVHAAAVRKIPRSYEHADPASVGNKRRILVSGLSGKANILAKAAELGFSLAPDSSVLADILEQVKAQEHKGYAFETAEGSLWLLIHQAVSQQAPLFSVEEYHVSMRRGKNRNVICEATVKVRVGGKVAHTVAEGDGPLNALDRALRSALVEFYPHLKEVRLADYKVQILNDAEGSAAKTRVLIQTRDGLTQWGTVGVDPNIVEASLKALVDGIHWALLQK